MLYFLNAIKTSKQTISGSAGINQHSHTGGITVYAELFQLIITGSSHTSFCHFIYLTCCFFPSPVMNSKELRYELLQSNVFLLGQPEPFPLNNN